MDDQTTKKKPTPVGIIAIPRLGRVQMMLFVEGEGIQQKIKAKISRLVLPEEMERDPGAAHVWEMEDLAALEKLCERATNFAMEAQTVLPMRKPPQPPQETPHE